MEINQSEIKKSLNYQNEEQENSIPNTSVDKSIKKHIIKKVNTMITSAIIASIIAIVKSDLSKGFIKKQEEFLGPYEGIDEDKIQSLINVEIFDMKKKVFGFDLYSLTIDEKVFDILHMKIISTKNIKHLLKWINKEVLVKKLKAKMRKNVDLIAIIETLEKEFNNVG